MTGLSREKAANVIAAYFGTQPDHVGRGYDTYEIPDTTGRKWKIVSDSSIDARYRDGTRAPDTYRVEMVTPICKYEDIPTYRRLSDSFGVREQDATKAAVYMSMWMLHRTMPELFGIW